MSGLVSLAVLPPTDSGIRGGEHLALVSSPDDRDPVVEGHCPCPVACLGCLPRTLPVALADLLEAPLKKSCLYRVAGYAMGVHSIGVQDGRERDPAQPPPRPPPSPPQLQPRSRSNRPRVPLCCILACRLFSISVLFPQSLLDPTPRLERCCTTDVPLLSITGLRPEELF